MPDILAIVGSVEFACPDGEAIARRLVADELTSRRPDRVVSGGAKGVDTIGVAVAAQLGIDYTEHHPGVRRWDGPNGFKARNQLIARDCTRALRIVCAKSRTYGSGYCVDLAQRRGKPVRRVVIHPDGTWTDSGWPTTTPDPDQQGALPL